MADQSVEGMPQRRRKEPAWHRRERAKRSQARMQVRLAESVLALSQHHGSKLPKLVAAALRPARRTALQEALLKWGLPEVVEDAVMQDAEQAGAFVAACDVTEETLQAAVPPQEGSREAAPSAIAQAEVRESASTCAGDGEAAAEAARRQRLTTMETEAAELAAGASEEEAFAWIGSRCPVRQRA